MLLFAISVRSPANSSDYGKVEASLRSTLDSICRQTTDAYRVAVVVNQPLSFDPPAQVDVVTVDFPPATRPGGHPSNEEVISDKGSKLTVALLASRGYRATHVMIVDADDFVSRRLAQFVGDHPDNAGWYVDRGYMYAEPHRLMRRQERFNDVCGTSLIVNIGLLHLPDAPATSSKEEILERVGPLVVHDLLGSHRRAVGHFAAQGTPLQPLPFPGAVYRVGTGENHLGREPDRFAVPVGWRGAKEFGLPLSVTDSEVLKASARRGRDALGRRLTRLGR